ncbi:MAG: hypothetical protein ACREL6_02710, partial [Gemmatimonadales bacterium]
VVDRALISRKTEGTAALFLGELKQELALGLRYRPVRATPVTPAVTVNITRELVRQFTPAGEEITGLRIYDAVGFAGAEHEFVAGWTARAGLEVRVWEEPGRRGQDATGGRLVMEKGGSLAERLFRADVSVNEEYRRFTVEGIFTAAFGEWRIRPRIRYGWGENLPVHLAFPLGGDDGFPGLHVGELRGDREALAGLIVTHPFIGPVLARVEAMTGRTASGGPAIPEGRWLFGVRAGLGLETSLGPVRVEYGRTRDDRDALFVRLGRWF